MQQLSSSRCFDGEQRIYQHPSSSTDTDMKLGVYLPPQALAGQACPVLIYLAGLTCTEETFPFKAHAQQQAAALGLILISPDTSPRGDGVASAEHWSLGQGAGFYVNASQAPWSAHYQMQRYIAEELPELLRSHFAITQIGLMGHSMGGHGALTLAQTYPQVFRSVSAIAPIAAPMDCAWGQAAFSTYLGDDQTQWAAHDASRLMRSKGAQFDHILVDQGLSDQFLSQLHPDAFVAACDAVGQSLSLRQHAGYDHGYYFIQTVIGDHLAHHMQRLSLI